MPGTTCGCVGQFLANDYTAAIAFHPPTRDRIQRGRAHRLARSQVETGVMPRTPDRLGDNQAFGQRSAVLRASGADVVDFGAGEPDFDTPANIKRAADEAMRAGRTKYTSAGGVRPLQATMKPRPHP